MRLLRWIAFAVLAFTALGAACTFPRPYGYQKVEDVPPAVCHSNVSQLFAAPEFTDPAEQEALTAAADAWRTFSGGQVDFVITFTGPGRAVIRRVLSTDPAVPSEEATTGAKPGTLLGWEKNGDVNLIVDRIRADQLQALAEHELGHAADLRWPLCTLTPNECVHSPDPAAVMAPEFSGTSTFTPSDLALCRASCHCP